jgi:hypothetical protein
MVKFPEMILEKAIPDRGEAPIFEGIVETQVGK